MENPSPSRPFFVTSVALITFFTAVFIFVIFVGAGMVMVLMPLDPKYNPLFARGFGLVVMLGGLWGGGVTALLAWRFYQLDPSAYAAHKAMAWHPQYWIATRFGQRYNDPDVRKAFRMD